MPSPTQLAIDKAYGNIFRRFIPRHNIVFLSFCPRIETPYGKDAGLVSDTVFLPAIIRIPTAKYERLAYSAFTTKEEQHVAQGFLLNIFKGTSTTFVDRKLEIADVSFHFESMVTNVMIDTLDYIENDLLVEALSQVATVHANSGVATGKVYNGAPITERSLKDEVTIDTLLLNKNARFMTERISGTLAFGTLPVPLSFIEITSVAGGQEIIKTYLATNNFVTAVEYGMAARSAEAVNSQRFEIGYVRKSNRRIMVTKNFPRLETPNIDGGTEQVYSSLVMGADAFYIYMPSNRFIETLVSSNQFTSTDTSADKIRFNVKVTYGLTNEIYGHALKYVWLGAQ